VGSARSVHQLPGLEWRPRPRRSTPAPLQGVFRALHVQTPIAAHTDPKRTHELRNRESARNLFPPTSLGLPQMPSGLADALTALPRVARVAPRFNPNLYGPSILKGPPMMEASQSS
jgi:hypothetical protein